MIHIKQFVFNPFMENTYVVYDDSKQAMIVDPGCYEDYEKNDLLDFIQTNELKVMKLLNTHCHIDHVLGNNFVLQNWKVPFLMHELDLPVLQAVPSYAVNYGFANYLPAQPTEFIQEGQQITVGNISFDVIHLPGHAPGHIGLMNEKERIFVGGDVLFQGSIGRTDLPGGDHDTLINSIQKKLFTYHDDVVVYPGHGDTTTLGIEKNTNPFCAIR